MRMDRLTNQLQNAIADAQSIAVGKDNPSIEQAHLLSALLNQQGGSVKPMLSQAGFDMPGLLRGLGEILERLPQVQSPTGEVNLSPDLARLLNLADKQAQQQGDQFISSDALLLALMDDKSEVARLMGQNGDKGKLQQVIQQVRGGESVNSPEAEESRQALEKYTIDLTERAEGGKLDPVIGRDEEIRRTIQV
ncbi:MAG: Clp protease N-terminal domain-containing protein, partial [bacterium]